MHRQKKIMDMDLFKMLIVLFLVGWVMGGRYLCFLLGFGEGGGELKRWKWHVILVAYGGKGSKSY